LLLHSISYAQDKGISQQQKPVLFRALTSIPTTMVSVIVLKPITGDTGVGQVMAGEMDSEVAGVLQPTRPLLAGRGFHKDRDVEQVRPMVADLARVRDGDWLPEEYGLLIPIKMGSATRMKHP
jgi:hypothetical protein